MTLSRLVLALGVLLASVSLYADDKSPPAASEEISYFKQIRPLFQQHCQGCHQPAKAQGSYVMTDYATLMKSGESGKPSITPGQPDKSYLLDEIRVKDGQAEMPKNRDPLKTPEYKLIEDWIRQGAKDDTPASAKAVAYTAENPPQYAAPPVITSLAFSPDGKHLAVTGYHEILLFTADGKQRVARFVGMSERIQSLAFSPDGKLLAAAGGAPGRFGEVQIWNIAREELMVSTPVSYDTVYGLSWSPDGKAVAVGCADNTVRAFDPSNGQQILFMGTHADWVLGTTFSRDGEHLVSVSRDMSVKLTEVATQRFIDNVTSITPGALKGGLMAIDVRPVTEQKLQKVPPDTPGAKPKQYDEIIVAGSDGTPRLYKMHREEKRVIGDDANRIRQFDPMTGRISTIRFSPDGLKVAAASSLDGKGQVRVYDANTGKTLIDCEGVNGPAYTVTWTPDGKTIASGGFDGKVWLHDAATGKLIKAFDPAPVSTAQK